MWPKCHTQRTHESDRTPPRLDVPKDGGYVLTGGKHTFSERQVLCEFRKMHNRHESWGQKFLETQDRLFKHDSHGVWANLLPTNLTPTLLQNYSFAVELLKTAFLIFPQLHIFKKHKGFQTHKQECKLSQGRPSLQIYVAV